MAITQTVSVLHRWGHGWRWHRECGNSADGAPTGSTADIYSEGNVIQTIVDFNGGSSAQETQTSYNSESESTYRIPPDGVSAGAAGSNPYETASSTRPTVG